MGENAESVYEAMTRLCMRLEKLRQETEEVGYEAAETRRSLIVLRDNIRAVDDPDFDPPGDDVDGRDER